MISSMTGFGRAELKSDRGTIRVEMRSTNHKFFEIFTRLPVHLGEFEDLIRRVAAKELRRGKIVVNLTAPAPASFSGTLVLNEPLARQVHQKILRLERVLGLQAKLTEEKLFSEVLRFPDVLMRDSAASAPGAAFSRELERALMLAARSLHESRAREGRALTEDLHKRLGEIRRALAVIEKRLPVLARDYRASLERRVKAALPGGAIDREKLTTEVAQYLKNSDISEEVTRLRTHVAAMARSLSESGELGRKIDFIAQEMYREANTMGSKSGDVEIANQVIQLKSAIEKIREQAQNVE